MSIISSSLAGLQAAQQRAVVAAQNTANANTPNAKALDYTQTTGTNGDVQGSVTYRNPATIKTIDSDGNDVDLPNIDLNEEALNIQGALNDFQANTKVLQVAKDTQKHLIDILA